MDFYIIEEYFHDDEDYHNSDDYNSSDYSRGSIGALMVKRKVR